MNPNMQRMMNMAKMVKGIKNPQEFIINASKNNPMLQNLVKMAQSGDEKSLKDFGRNFFKEKGLNFDEELNTFKSMFN